MINRQDAPQPARDLVARRAAGEQAPHHLVERTVEGAGAPQQADQADDRQGASGDDDIFERRLEEALERRQIADQLVEQRPALLRVVNDPAQHTRHQQHDGHDRKDGAERQRRREQRPSGTAVDADHRQDTRHDDIRGDAFDDLVEPRLPTLWGRSADPQRLGNVGRRVKGVGRLVRRFRSKRRLRACRRRQAGTLCAPPPELASSLADPVSLVDR